ncbi:MAG: FISUMP domain-containing protein [Patescibacteria group bacterium]|jgi:uncharacterized protein (TIGR02145 family)|nr:FISUMP domain-containing protein [Patescibacteria group bacterium]
MFLKISKKIKQDRRGSALILTMTIMIAGILVFSSIASVSLVQRSASSKARSSTEALQMADSCAEWFLMKYYATSQNDISDIGSISVGNNVFVFTDEPNGGTLSIDGEDYTVDCELYLIDINDEIIGDDSDSLDTVMQVKSVGIAGFGEDITKRAVQIGLSGCPETFEDNRDSEYDAGVSQEYRAVKIGDQCWMAENLRVGETILGGSEMDDDGDIERYCYENDSDNCYSDDGDDNNDYGGLYQWDEMMQGDVEGEQGICPDGWHVPSDEEWHALELEFAADPVGDCPEIRTSWQCDPAGTALKSGGLSGFNGLLAGGRLPSGTFASLSSHTYFWSSSVSGVSAWRRDLDLTVNPSTIKRDDTGVQAYGWSVRCVKD